MPAESKAQRGLAGASLAYKRGTLKGKPSPAVKRMAQMSEAQLKDFVHAPLGNLPVRVKTRGARRRKK